MDNEERKVDTMKFNIALCQMKGSVDKEDSKKTAAAFIREAAEGGADIVTLPEMWNCPYATENFRKYGETAEGDTVEFLSRQAAEHGIYLVGGSIPELDGDKVYNTAFAFDKKGEKIARHRKAHLFDIDVKGGIRFMESDVLSPGDTATVFDTEFCKVGLAICYDIRFPELSRTMALRGAELIILPGAFNMTTGPAHWELSVRARALDNQVYFAACEPARDETASYTAWGHSTVADPWGEVIATTGHEEAIVRAEIDLEKVRAIREQLPLLRHRREELYD